MIETEQAEELRHAKERIAQLEARDAEQQRRIHQLERSNGALMVDRDRGISAALDTARDCTAHGRGISYLRHAASWYWQEMTSAEDQRGAIVGGLLVHARSLRERPAEDFIKAGDLADMLTEAVDKQKKIQRRKPGYPTFADCPARKADGSCEHDHVSEDVRRELAEVFGLHIKPF
jgi:hypothetical protein